MNTNLSFSVFTANLISLLLLGTLYFSNRQKKNHDRDMRIILRMMVITAISNVADLCVFYLDGSSGMLLYILVFLSGSWLFELYRSNTGKCKGHRPLPPGGRKPIRFFGRLRPFVCFYPAPISLYPPDFSPPPSVAQPI